MCLAKNEDSPQKEAVSPRSPWAKLLNRQVRILSSSSFHLPTSEKVFNLTSFQMFYYFNLPFPSSNCYCLHFYHRKVNGIQCQQPNVFNFETNVFLILSRAPNRACLERWHHPREWISTSAGRSWESSSPTHRPALTYHRKRLHTQTSRSSCRSLTSSTPWTRSNRRQWKTTITRKTRTSRTPIGSSWSPRRKSTTTWPTKSARSATPPTKAASYVTFGISISPSSTVLKRSETKSCLPTVDLVRAPPRAVIDRLPLDLVKWCADRTPAARCLWSSSYLLVILVIRISLSGVPCARCV